MSLSALTSLGSQAAGKAYNFVANDHPLLATGIAAAAVGGSLLASHLRGSQPAPVAQYLQPTEQIYQFTERDQAHDQAIASIQEQQAAIQALTEQARITAAKMQEERDQMLRNAEAEAEARRRDAERAMLAQQQAAVKAEQEKLTAAIRAATRSGSKESDSFPTLLVALIAVLVVVVAAYMAISHVQ